MYVVVFHGRDRIGYYEAGSTNGIDHAAQAGYFFLRPLHEHAMSALSYDGTYIIPFVRADEIVIVDDLKSLRVNL